ncbi:fatty acyl-AMP ligase [Streptomyces kanamyceticus]|uniref:fatty acyl-AMP ligase n=1 Tax=Streptomyces kanamyceticus TaxID=1967 RepID=UPI0012FEC5C1|nr:fatty acyl-AMP ligase [Streptomyces kanamyceticus]
MSDRQTLAHALAAHAETRGDTAAISYTTPRHGEQALTYGQLCGRAAALGAVLNGLPSRTHHRPFVLIALPNGLDYVASFFACAFADAVAVTFHPPTLSTARAGRAYDHRLEQILRDCEPSAIIAQPDLHPRLREVSRAAGLDPLVLDPQAADNPPSGLTGFRGPQPRPEHLALLQYTSGSTSNPKGVMVSHANLVHNVTRMSANLGTGPGQTAAGWLPLFHDMGLIGMVCHPLWAGMSLHMATPAGFLRNPLRWLQTLSRIRATFTIAPDFGYATAVQKITEEQREGLDLSALRHALNGAEPVRPRTIEQFAKAYAPHGFDPHAMMPAYGLAEATLVVSCLGRKAAPALSEVSADALGAQQRAAAVEGTRNTVLVGCGRALAEDTEIVMVDPVTRLRKQPGEVGEIWVHGPSVAGGYWGRPTESDSTFRARLAHAVHQDSERTYLRTGDLGVWHEDQVCVVGRIKDVIVHRGTNHYPHDIEGTVEESHPLAVRAAALSVPQADGGERGQTEQVVLVCELTDYGDHVDYDAVIAAARNSVLEEHGIPVAAVGLLRAGAVPRTTSGKVRRQEAVRRWSADELRPVALWRRGLISEGGQR